MRGSLEQSEAEDLAICCFFELCKDGLYPGGDSFKESLGLFVQLEVHASPTSPVASTVCSRLAQDVISNM